MADALKPQAKPSKMVSWLRAWGVEFPAEIAGAGTIAVVSYLLRGRKTTSEQRPKTRKMIEIILTLYPRVAPASLDNDLVNRTEWLAGEGKGHPDDIRVIADYSAHGERNRRIRENIAARQTAVNIAKRSDRLAWEASLSNTQREQIELLSDQALHQLIGEDDLAERDTIVRANTEKSLLEAAEEKMRSVSRAWKQGEERLHQIWTHLTPENRTTLMDIRDWAERRRQRRETKVVPATDVLRWTKGVHICRQWIPFIPGIVGVIIIIVVTYINMTR